MIVFVFLWQFAMCCKMIMATLFSVACNRSSLVHVGQLLSGYLHCHWIRLLFFMMHCGWDWLIVPGAMLDELIQQGFIFLSVSGCAKQQLLCAVLWKCRQMSYNKQQLPTIAIIAL
jgi:hypothetical protein